jgi:hypothetical protein
MRLDGSLALPKDLVEKLHQNGDVSVADNCIVLGTDGDDCRQFFCLVTKKGVEQGNMAGIPQLMFLLGVAVYLGACTSEQVPAPLPQAMYQDNPTKTRKVQIALRDRGDYAGFVDGYLGQYTGDGIQRFEVEHCLRVKPVIDRSLLVSLGIAND